ncbi:hypothetical protein L228DRAFT_264072 [Xylona heveae TC161]|uniref:CCHC-type domain-containing protein n=1 Tax=Xylona heveae (strain CBS 132557 / TC161) TaxID=1328760 RepID=A0A164ZCU4_XYLHT|nr:hypothetical protein L228DRAFT_264072 [Xylona heveae TC161]KZF18945.1 hypothetical protein L228DRAFT_264072 [Xylona heveae TC161]
MSWDDSGADPSNNWGSGAEDAWKGDNSGSGGKWNNDNDGNFEQDPESRSKHADGFEASGGDGEGCPTTLLTLGTLAAVNPVILLANAPNLVSLAANVSTAAKPAIIKPIARIRGSSKEPVVFARKKDTLPLNALINRLTSARTVVKKVWKPGHAELPRRPDKANDKLSMSGHKTIDCKNNRFLDYTGIETKSPEESWKGLQEADATGDLDDVRDALRVYYKAVPLSSYAEIEQAFRDHHFATYLIAREKSINDSQTIMDLQGKLGCKYEVGLYLSPKVRRKAAAEGWPPTPEENKERLLDAGIVVDRLVPICDRCREAGHVSKFCKEEKPASERPIVKCANCHEEGHRVRDCPQERVDQFACRNCKQPGHNAAECPEPRSAEGVECKNCNEKTRERKQGLPKLRVSIAHQIRVFAAANRLSEEGHMARDCDKPRNPDTVQCRNCDQTKEIQWATSLEIALNPKIGARSSATIAARWVTPSNVVLQPLLNPRTMRLMSETLVLPPPDGRVRLLLLKVTGTRAVQVPKPGKPVKTGSSHAMSPSITPILREIRAMFELIDWTHIVPTLD